MPKTVCRFTADTEALKASFPVGTTVRIKVLNRSHQFASVKVIKTFPEDTGWLLNARLAPGLETEIPEFTLKVSGRIELAMDCAKAGFEVELNPPAAEVPKPKSRKKVKQESVELEIFPTFGNPSFGL